MHVCMYVCIFFRRESKDISHNSSYIYLTPLSIYIYIYRFCVYMWLPLFLERMLGQPRGLSGFLPLLFELGGLVGSPTLGLSADW